MVGWMAQIYQAFLFSTLISIVIFSIHDFSDGIASTKLKKVNMQEII